MCLWNLACYLSLIVVCNAGNGGSFDRTCYESFVRTTQQGAIVWLPMSCVVMKNVVYIEFVMFVRFFFFLVPPSNDRYGGSLFGWDQNESPSLSGGSPAVDDGSLEEDIAYEPVCIVCIHWCQLFLEKDMMQRNENFY